MTGHKVTLLVHLCITLLVAGWPSYRRHEVGRYLPSKVLGTQVHVMLPAWVTGDNSRYLLLEVIWLLAFGPAYITLIKPPATSTLET